MNIFFCSGLFSVVSSPHGVGDHHRMINGRVGDSDENGFVVESCGLL